MLLSYDTAWWPDVRAVMAATLNNCRPGTIYRAQQINRSNWREAIIGGQLPVPYQVVHVLKATIADGALDNVEYFLPLTIYGVYSVADPFASIEGNGKPPFDITTYVASQAAALRDGLLAYGGGTFQITEEVPFIDVSDTNAPNERFLVNNAPLLAFALDCYLKIGQNYSGVYSPDQPPLGPAE